MCDWLEKYAPRSVQYFLGSKTASENLLQWLKDWKGFYEKTSMGKTPPRNKSVLITGPCGCGKTSLARAACADVGIVNVLELCSIDKRTKETIEEIQDAFRVRPILSFIPTADSGLQKKHGGKPGAIIIDEIDHCGAGGLPAIMKCIKTTRAPIICIASDKYGKTLQPLIDMSLHLRLMKPTADQISSYIQYIAMRENISDRITKGSARALAVACNCDVRQTIMEFYITSKSPTKTMAISRNEDGFICDSPMGAFDMIPKLFPAGPRGVTPTLAERLYLSDRSLVPLMVSENYLKASSVIVQKDLAKLAEAADSISFSNVIEGGMVKFHAWEMTEIFGYFSTARPCGIVGGPMAARVDFPVLLSKTTIIGRNSKMLSDLSKRIEEQTTSRPDAVATELMWIFRTKYVRPLISSSSEGKGKEKGGEQAVASRIAKEISEEYDMDKADWDFINGMSAFKEISLSPTVKASLTRAFSSRTRKRQRDTLAPTGDEDTSEEEEEPVQKKKRY